MSAMARSPSVAYSLWVADDIVRRPSRTREGAKIKRKSTSICLAKFRNLIVVAPAWIISRQLEWRRQLIALSIFGVVSRNAPISDQTVWVEYEDRETLNPSSGLQRYYAAEESTCHLKTIHGTDMSLELPSTLERILRPYM